MKNKFFNNDEALRAYADYERQIYTKHLEVGSYLVMTLMPAGVVLDYFVYPQKVAYFLGLRLVSALLGGVIWLALHTRLRNKIDRYLSLALALMPAFFICWMIYATDGVSSSYYAGLNLVLLSVALVMRWSVDLSVVASTLVILMYLAACSLHGATTGSVQPGVLVNNLYFLSLTAIIVAVSGWIHHTLRVREFILNYELDQSKRELELSNTRLAEQNIALNQANREIKAAEMQLVQSEKLSSLGRFSAGLMHDILNPLNYSKTGLFTLHKKSRNLPPEMRAEFDPILTDIQDGVDRVQEIVQSLRNFTHPGEQAAEAIDLTAILNDARRFVSGGLNDKNISLELNIPSKQKVWIGRNDFSVVLINLLENSIDALEGKQFDLEEKPTIAVTSRSEGNRTVIAIRDNGPGIDPKIIAKIFDPFFTTKDVGKGTGLGLSICFGMIRGYGGTISVASEPGKFSEFTLDLPATAEAAAQTKLSHAEPIRL